MSALFSLPKRLRNRVVRVDFTQFPKARHRAAGEYHASRAGRRGDDRRRRACGAASMPGAARLNDDNLTVSPAGQRRSNRGCCPPGQIDRGRGCKIPGRAIDAIGAPALPDDLS
jgi:hypothetical protein